MIIDDALIDKLATLSRLRYEGEEREEIKRDLERMIGMVEKMNELDTTGVEPLLHMTNNVNSLRADVAAPPMDNTDALQNAAKTQEPFFVVPKVIRK